MAHHVLVVGGAGYIGAHMVRQLLRDSCMVTVLDDLSAGHRESVLGQDLVVADMGDATALTDIFSSRRIDAVMHFAASADVGESLRVPAKYFENNVTKTLMLLDAMLKFGVKRLVFSSTCSVYGAAGSDSIAESAPIRPINPYGISKRIVEDILATYATAYGMRSYCLRYFNAAGADPDGSIGEDHTPETHLIPLALRVAAGRISQLNILGSDYPTRDGTGVRDFIHVSDLCSAHALCLRELLNDGDGGIYNVGVGRGYSVLEVVAAVEEVTGLKVSRQICARRPGDPPSLVADSRLIQQQLGWRPQYTDLRTIVEHAWAWELRLAQRQGNHSCGSD